MGAGERSLHHSLGSLEFLAIRADLEDPRKMKQTVLLGLSFEQFLAIKKTELLFVCNLVKSLT